MAFRPSTRTFPTLGNMGSNRVMEGLIQSPRNRFSEAAEKVSAVHTAAVRSLYQEKQPCNERWVRQSRQSPTVVWPAPAQTARVRRNCECGHVFDYRRLGRRSQRRGGRGCLVIPEGLILYSVCCQLPRSDHHPMPLSDTSGHVD